MLDKLVFASKNKGKIREIKHLFANINVDVEMVPDSFDPVENGNTFLDNAIIKARTGAKLSKKVTLADDSGLVVDALNGAPGVHSSRYANSDSERINKLLNAMEEVPEEKRQARFICAMALVDSAGNLLHSTEGVLEGKINYAPCGTDGFGFDPVFYVPQLNLTLAQIPLDHKNKISHRACALAKMLEWIKLNKCFTGI